MTPQQLDLFAWSKSQRAAKKSYGDELWRPGEYDHLPNVVDFIPHAIRQICRQQRQPRVKREGRLIDFPTTPEIKRIA